ncbi:MAG: efflux RND transporter permease subunit [Bacteroidetes bacterium]|nr:efflux RND transporter permease subunit [Bacteroidota bacterium]
MKIWNIAVDNRIAVYLLIILILVFGLTSYFLMPREAAPEVKIPLIIVAVPYVGVSPLDIEGLITQHLERALKGLKDLKEISSVSKEGLSTIRIEFNTGVDIDEALRRVRDKVNSTQSELPPEILDPIISEVNISEFPIMYVNVGGNVGLARLKNIAENLQDKIEAVPGILRADLIGGMEPEVQVNVDVYRMNAYQIGFDDIANAVKAENLNIPGGTIDTKKQTLAVRIPGEFKQVKPLEDIVLKIQNNKPIYLRDVATVDYSFEDRQTYARLNNLEVVSLAVRKRAGENLVGIAEEVKKIVDEEQSRLPDGIRVDISNDDSKFIVRMVDELENTVITGMVLVVLSLFMFFGFKNAILISTAIPLSMCIGFILLSIFGVTLNMVVLFSLVLVLGILVDDSIVVIENTYRHQQDYGEKPDIAAKAAAGEVFIPVLTSTITILSAFFPLLFWPGIVGDFMKYLPITLLSTLTASMFVAYIISPVQAAQWINYRRDIKKAKKNLEHPHWYKKYNPFTWLYHEVDDKFFPWIQNKYVETLRWTLSHKGQTMLLSTAFFFFVLIIFILFNKGVEFFPNTEPSQVSLSIETPPGTSLDVTKSISDILEDRLNTISERNDIEFVATMIGSSSSDFDFGAQGTPNKGTININFHEKAKRNQSSFKTLEEIRTTTVGLAGADIRVSKQQMGPPVGDAVSIEITGEDYSQLASISESMREKIKNVNGLVDLRDDYNAGRPEIEIIVDREKAGIFYTSTSQIAATVRAAISGIEASKYRIGEDEYKIRVRLQEDQRISPSDLEKIHINFMNRRGQILSIPLTSVAELKRTTAVTDIKRKDQKRVVTISGDVEGRVQSEVLKEVQEILSNEKLPEGYSIEFTGSQEEQQKASSFLSRVFVITLLVIFFIMVSEFNSIKVPLVILVSVILSLIGVMIGLVITRTPVSVLMTGVGVIALAGIVVRNAIVLLDFVKHKFAEGGVKLDEALVEAGRIRLRPVILTAVTTVFGVLPMATGIDFDWFNFHPVFGAESSDFWRPLAVTIIFGLSVSTFLTLIIVPTVYSLFDEWTVKLRDKWVNKFGTDNEE